MHPAAWLRLARIEGDPYVIFVFHRTYGGRIVMVSFVRERVKRGRVCFRNVRKTGETYGGAKNFYSVWFVGCGRNESVRGRSRERFHNASGAARSVRNDSALTFRG